MNATPRGLNRVLLALIGLVFLAAGTLLVAIAAVPAVATLWQNWAGAASDSLRAVATRTTLASTGTSGIWIGVAVACVVLIILMVLWVAAQGKGRANVLAHGSEKDDGGAPGLVTISGAVAEQALKSALSARTDLVGATVATYEMDGVPGLRVRVLPRQGVAPDEVARDIADLVEGLDAVLGRSTAVLVSIGAGARTRFTRAERVR